MDLNWDRVLYVATICFALAAGAFVGLLKSELTAPALAASSVDDSMWFWWSGAVWVCSGERG